MIDEFADHNHESIEVASLLSGNDKKRSCCYLAFYTFCLSLD